MSADDQLVLCIGAGRTYGAGPQATVALQPADCVVRTAQQIAVTGPSGSGKSTLLHLMAGLDQPTVGQISWPAIGQLDALRPGPIALVFQGPSLLPPLTVEENVALPLVLAGMRQDDARRHARIALDVLELAELSEKLPEEISGGQAQRVAVARALAGKPRLILADEPTGQLDHTNAAIVVDVLLASAEHSGAALVISTHDPAVAARLPMRWTVNDGRLDTSPMKEATWSR